MIRVFWFGLRLRWRRLGGLRRTLFYSLAVLATLALASYRWVWTHPGQVRLRVTTWLEDQLDRTVRVGASRQTWARGLEISSLRIEGPRGQLAPSPPLAVFENLRVDDPNQTAGFAPGRKLRALFKESKEPRRLVRAVSGVIRLDAANLTGDLDQILAGLLENLASSTGSTISEQAVDVRLDRLELVISGDGLAETWKLRGIHLRTSGTGEWIAIADVDSAEVWDQALLEIWARPSTGEWRLESRLENLDSRALAKSPWGKRVAKTWESIGIAGTWNATVSANRAKESPATWRIETEHYDSQIELEAPDIDVEHFRGVVRVEPDLVTLVPVDGAETCRSSLWGIDSQLEGSLNARSGHVSLTVPTTRVRDLRIERSPDVMQHLLRSLRPAGEIEGRITAGVQSWRADFSLSSWQLELFPEAVLDRARLILNSSDTENSELVISGLNWGNSFGSLRGRLQIHWDQDIVELVGRDLEVIPAAGETARGKVRASWNIDRKTGDVRGQGTWRGLRVDTSFARADKSDGEFRTTSPDRNPQGDLRVQQDQGFLGGSFNLENVTLLRGGPDGGPLSFDRGHCFWTRARGGFRIFPLHLTGRGRALRAYGKVHPNGQLDLLCLLVVGDRALALDQLDERRPVADWVEAVDSRDMTTWRLTGTFSAPIAEPVDTYSFVHHLSFDE